MAIQYNSYINVCIYNLISIYTSFTFVPYIIYTVYIGDKYTFSISSSPPQISPSSRKHDAFDKLLVKFICAEIKVIG